MTYTITVYDQAGEYTSCQAGSLAEAGRTAQRLRHYYGPRKVVVVVSNQDNVDLGNSDGLTDDERAELEGMGL